MKVYKIHRWDSILPQDSSNSLPMIYISADSELLKYAQKNNYCFEVEIRGTDSLYDNKKMLGTFDSLLIGPNCYSDIIIDKNWYTIALTSYFYKYPPQLGEVIISNLEDTLTKESFKIPENTCENYIKTPEKIPEEIPPVKTNTNQDTDLVGMNVGQITTVLSLIFIILILIIFVFNVSK